MVSYRLDCSCINTVNLNFVVSIEQRALRDDHVSGIAYELCTNNSRLETWHDDDEARDGARHPSFTSFGFNWIKTCSIMYVYTNDVMGICDECCSSLE